MWTGPGYVLLMLQHFCVYEAPSWLLHLEDMCSSIFHVRLGPLDRGIMCVISFFCVIWPIVFCCALASCIDQPSVTVDFQLNLFFSSKLLYFIVFKLVHFPCY